MPFAPVHEGQEEAPAPEPEKSADAPAEARPPVGPRVIEVKPAVRIVPRRKLEIVHVFQP